MRRLCVFALVALTLACGGPRRRTRLGTEQTETEVAAPAPSVAAYQSPPPAGEAITGGGDVDAVREAIEAAATERHVEVTGDPRLATLSEWIADRLSPAGDPPPPEVLSFFAWNLGIPDPPAHVLVLGLPDRASMGDEVRRSADQYFGRQSYTHYGGTVLPRNGMWIIVVCLSWRLVTLDAIPRRIEPGTPIRVHGRLATGLQNPTLAIQLPSGEVTRQPAGSGPEFDVRVPTSAAGAYRVEILARGEHGETVVANAPVYAGQDPPRTVRLDAEDESAPTTDVATLRQQLIERLNRTRSEVGLPALHEDARLDQIALAHSQDMQAHHFVGHTSPTTGVASDRVRSAGIQSGLVLENIGRGYSAAEIHQGLLDSPGHRANLVNPAATHVGIGIVSETEGDRVAFLVTEIFIQVSEAIDTTAAAQQILEQLNRSRVARHAPALQMEPNLQAAAGEAARQFFADPHTTQQDTVDSASASLRRFSIAYRRIGGVMAVVTSVDEATQLEPALDDSVHVCGIGVAQGTRPDTGPNALAVVIVLAWER